MSIEDRPPFSPAPDPRRPSSPFERSEAGVHAHLRGKPIVCGIIIATCVAFYVLEALVLGTPLQMHHVGMLHGPDVHNGELWRLVTHVFEHGGIFHLVLNMSVVVTLGTRFERDAGHGVVALVSLITAMGSATVSLLFSYDANMLGASGMVIGWAGAILPIASEQWRRSLITWLVQIAIISFLPFVSWQGHLGGFLFGLACGFLLKLGLKTFWRFAPFLAIASIGTALAATHPALHPG